MPYSLHLQSRVAQVSAALERALNAPEGDLAPAALAIARVEYPSLDTSAYIAALDALGEEAAERVRRTGEATARSAIRAINEYLYDEERFTGNRERYDDPRNNFLNEVLDRRTGIPITLAVVYMEVARRAGVVVQGVNFPGHFLLRAPAATPGWFAGPKMSGVAAAHAAEIEARGPAPGRTGARREGHSEFIIVDPFHGGALLSEIDCRELLRQHVGEEAAFDRALLQPATRHSIVIRMLVNLKRLYVRMRSFPQARFVSDLLLAIDPSAISELRDRGLLAYHLQDFGAALRDLEEYLRLLPRQTDTPSAGPQGTSDQSGDEERGEETSENSEVWEHVKTLRKRVAGFN